MFVYLIHLEQNHSIVKIGKAVNPKSRLKELQTGCPYKLKIMGLIECKNEEQAIKTEKVAHSLFKKSHFRGEWFKLDKDQRESLKSLIESVQLRHEQERIFAEATALGPIEKGRAMGK